MLSILMYLLAICISSFENYLFNSFAHLLIVLFLFCCITFLHSYVFWIYVRWISGKDFLLFVGYLSTLLIVFAVHKLFNLVQSRLLILPVNSWLIWVLCHSKSHCLCLDPEVFPLFSYWNFKGSGTMCF
jgi:hypothetical protein